MKNNFDLRKFLTENKLTENSKMLNEGIGKDYLDKVARDYFQVKDFDDAIKNGIPPNSNDVAVWIGDTETDEIDESELSKFKKEGNYEIKQVAEYQFQEEKYNFAASAGAGEYDSSTIIFKVVDKDGRHVPIKGKKGDKTYPYFATTDRGPLADTYPLLEEKHVNILKSVADIFEPNDPDY